MPTNLPHDDAWPVTIRMLVSLAATGPLRLTAQVIKPRSDGIFAYQRLKAVLALLATAKRVSRWGNPDRG